MAALRYPTFRALLRSQRPHTPFTSSQMTGTCGSMTFRRFSYAKRNPRPMRLFHESREQHHRFDESSIDFAYMPQYTLTGAAPPEVIRTPLLPHNDSPTGHKDPDESVIRPQISLVSADSTHIESPSAMSEVTDNSAFDMPLDLTNKMTAAVLKMTEVPMEQMGEAGILRQLWTGLMDDLFGPKPIPRA